MREGKYVSCLYEASLKLDYSWQCRHGRLLDLIVQKLGPIIISFYGLCIARGLALVCDTYITWIEKINISYLENTRHMFYARQTIILG